MAEDKLGGVVDFFAALDETDKGIEESEKNFDASQKEQGEKEQGQGEAVDFFAGMNKGEANNEGATVNGKRERESNANSNEDNRGKESECTNDNSEEGERAEVSEANVVPSDTPQRDVGAASRESTRERRIKIKKLPKSSKRKILIGTLCLCGVIVCAVAIKHIGKGNTDTTDSSSIEQVDRYMDSNITGEDNVVMNANEGVAGWCNAFLSRDYEFCDSLLTNPANGFSNFSVHSGVSPMSDTIYKEMLDRIGDSITNISIKRGKGNGTYEITVHYKPYVEKSDVELDGDTYKEICKKFYEGEYSEDDLERKVGECYQKWYGYYFEPSENEYLCTINLTEQDNDGFLTVSNTSAFYLKLLEVTNVGSLTEQFENDLSVQLNSMMSDF